MFVRKVFAVLLIYILWSLSDFMVHGIYLKPVYEASANLWRPMEEISIPLNNFLVLSVSFCFVAIYDLLSQSKCFNLSLLYGLLFGLASGLSMGLGSFIYMPIDSSLALIWFLLSLMQGIIAGLVVGILVKN